jgi:hypothetical protein
VLGNFVFHVLKVMQSKLKVSLQAFPIVSSGEMIVSLLTPFIKVYYIIILFKL